MKPPSRCISPVICAHVILNLLRRKQKQKKTGKRNSITTEVFFFGHQTFECCIFSCQFFVIRLFFFSVTFLISENVGAEIIYKKKKRNSLGNVTFNGSDLINQLRIKVAEQLRNKTVKICSGVHNHVSDVGFVRCLSKRASVKVIRTNNTDKSQSKVQAITAVGFLFFGV